MRVAECSLSLAGRFACSYAGCRRATGLWSLLLNYVAVNQADSEESEDGEGRGRAAPTNPPRGFILYLIVKGFERGHRSGRKHADGESGSGQTK